MLLPSALGSSPHPPVSVCGTGTWRTIAAFLDAWPSLFPTSFRSSRGGLPTGGGFSFRLSLRFPRAPSPVVHPIRVPTVLSPRSTGISTCCPSATAPALALGPDLPRADQLYSGNLGYSAWRILTSISLLIPAFSLHSAPLLFSVQFLRPCECSPTDVFTSLSFGGVFQPRSFSARDLSTSELLRTL